MQLSFQCLKPEASLRAAGNKYMATGREIVKSCGREL
jgi:hypothetical protein